MHSIKDILKQFNPTEDKYISRDFQAFGIYVAEKLGDERRKSLYIKMAKAIPRAIIEQALRFVIDSRAKNKAALFMWKLKEMGAFEKYPMKKEKKTTRKKRKTKTPSLFEA